MPCFNVPSHLRACLRIWPRVAVLAFVGIAVAGCENSARFDSNPFASNNRQPPPQPRQEVTGSIAPRPATGARVEAQPLPAPSRPATVASTGGVAYGDRGFAAYRPQEHTTEVTGSVPARREPPPPSGHWTWDGGAPVTVGYNESVEMIARKYGVPASAIMQTNGITRRCPDQAGPAPGHSALRRGRHCARACAARHRRRRRARARPRLRTSSSPAKHCSASRTVMA